MCTACGQGFHALPEAFESGVENGCAAFDDFKAVCSEEEFNAMGMRDCECDDCDRDNCPAEYLVEMTYERYVGHLEYYCGGCMPAMQSFLETWNQGIPEPGCSAIDEFK